MLAALAAVGVILFPGLSSATPTDNPTVTTGAATSVTNVSATLNGTVNPNDPDTSATYDYTFSLGTDSNNLSNAGGGSIPGDTNADPVSLPVSGLSPNTTYYFQLCAVNEADSTDSGCGATQSFQTPDQPAVTLASASAVTSTSATLNGSVDPNGASTSYLFYYGTSSHPDCNFYSDSIGGSAGNGTSSTPESKSISGLSPHTTYYFRLAASNSYGTVCSSSEGSFTTSDKPVVTLGSASSITSTTATLSGTVNPNGDATTYVFVYGTSSSADCTHYSSSSTGGSAGSGTSPTPESDSISGLSPKTTYFFRLSASNGTGTTCSSTQGSFTTPDKPTVTLGSASSVTNTSATLSGSVNPNGAATTYVFHYGTSSSATCSGYSGSSTGGSAGSGTGSTPESDSISGLSPKTTYFFRLAATNTYGTTCSGSEGSFTTADAPTSVTGSAAAITTHGATLNGTVNPNGSNVTSTLFKYCTGCTDASGGVTVGASPSPGAGTTAKSVSATLNGLQSGTQFHYMLCATNAYGTNCGGDQTFTTNAPPNASLTVDKTSGPTPLAVTFDGSGSTDPDGGTIASWSLTFGDGGSTSGTGAVPSSIAHTYQNACSCTASLLVTDNQGAQSSAATVAIHVTTNQPPVATLSGAPTSGTVPLAVTFDGSGSSDPDGIPLKSWSLDFGDGTPATTGTGPVGNAIPHTYSTAGTYQAVLTVTDSSNASRNSTAVTITANPPPAITVADVSKNEGNSGTTSFVFPLTLSAKSTHDVTVAYGTADGTATAGSDYTATSGTLTIPAGTDCTTSNPGNPACQITVPVTGETFYEADETFTLTLSNPTGATITTGAATGTIVNDDQRPLLMITTDGTPEGNTGSVVSGPQSWSDHGNLPLADASGLPTSDGAHTFYISTPHSPAVSGPYTYTGVSGNTLTGVSPGGSVSANQIAFQPRFLALHVLLCDPVQTLPAGTTDPSKCVATHSGFPTTVDYATSGGASLTTGIPVVEGQDYVSATGTLTIPAGAASGQLDFQIIPNRTPENPANSTYDRDRWFNVDLANAHNATIRQGAGIAHIFDDDAPNPPTAITGTASAIGTDHATVSASVNPNGPATDVYIEYGPTGAYGTQTAKQSLPAGSTDQPLAFSLTGLSPGTTYHYQVVATHTDGGAGYSGDATFKTDVPPTAALTANKTSGSVPLPVTFNGSGSSDPDGSIASWTLDFGDGSPPAGGNGAVPNSIPHTYSTCTCTASLVVTDNQGAQSTPATVSITVGPAGPPPSSPKLSTVDTTAPGPTSATIVFPVDPNGAQTKVWVEYGTTPSYGPMADPQTIPAGSPQTLTFTLTGLTPDTLYHVALFAAHTTDSGATHSQDLTFRTQKFKPIHVAVTAGSVRATTKGKVLLPFSCGGNSLPVCKGTVRLKLGKRAAGSAAFSVASGHRQLVAVKLAPFVWRRLRAGHALVLTLTLSVQTGHGLNLSTRPITVLPPHG